MLSKPIFPLISIKGVCPPWNQGFTFALAFLPLCPLPDVLPWPEDAPRPTLFRSFFAPGACSRLARICAPRIAPGVETCRERPAKRLVRVVVERAGKTPGNWSLGGILVGRRAVCGAPVVGEASVCLVRLMQSGEKNWELRIRMRFGSGGSCSQLAPIGSCCPGTNFLRPAIVQR